MLRIEIVYDGPGGVNVLQEEINVDAARIMELIEKWRVVAEEPCVHGHKCDVVKRLLNEFEVGAFG